ncbi:MAG: DNA polymerase III subunit delta, partial [Desulfotomaculaceae bacterium]|nr:DNA polymerase III subunit delta [Desulfotomaculaceae bacterium]
IEEKPAARGESVLLKYLKDPLNSTILVFNTGEPVDKRKRIFKVVQKAGRAVDFTYLKRNELARLLTQKVDKAGRRFAGRALDELLDTVGPSLQKLSMEFDKLLNYTAQSGVITPDDVRRLCPPPLEDNIFVIVDAVGNRRCGEALSGIKDMLAAKEPPLRILAMITRQFRLLLQVHDLAGRGCPPREIATRLKMHPFVVRKLTAQCKNYSGKSLVRIFQYLLEMDVAVKTGGQEFYPAVEHFILKLCAVSR